MGAWPAPESIFDRFLVEFRVTCAPTGTKCSRTCGKCSRTCAKCSRTCAKSTKKGSQPDSKIARKSGKSGVSRKVRKQYEKQVHLGPPPTAPGGFPPLRQLNFHFFSLGAFGLILEPFWIKLGARIPNYSNFWWCPKR